MFLTFITLLYVIPAPVWNPAPDQHREMHLFGRSVACRRCGTPRKAPSGASWPSSFFELKWWDRLTIENPNNDRTDRSETSAIEQGATSPAFRFCAQNAATTKTCPRHKLPLVRHPRMPIGEEAALFSRVFHWK